MKILATLAIVTAVVFGASAAQAKDENKVKNKSQSESVQVVPKQKNKKKPKSVVAPAPVVVPAPAPTPAPAPVTSPGTIDPYTQSLIDKALSRPQLHPQASCTYCAAFAASQGDLETVQAIGSLAPVAETPAPSVEAPPEAPVVETPAAPEATATSEEVSAPPSETTPTE